MFNLIFYMIGAHYLGFNQKEELNLYLLLYQQLPDGHIKNLQNISLAKKNC